MKSLRVEPTPGGDTDTLRMVKSKGKKETYVCSEAIKLPKFNFKSKKRQSAIQKNELHSSTEGGVIPRPQPRITSTYSPAAMQRPPPPLINSEYVTVTQTGVVQSAMPPTGRPGFGVNLGLSGRSGSPGQTRRQLTSLRTTSGLGSYQQSTYLGESPDRGFINAVYANAGPLDQEEKQVTSSYISGEFEKDEEFDTAQRHAEQTLVCEALRKVHPILEAWQEPVEESKGDLADKSSVRAAINNYLSTCIRLRSVDLQGQYSPFHYTLPTFDQRAWKKCAKLNNWGGLRILNEPQWSTEYVQLDPVLARDNHLLYADRTIDTMLTNWLDCHHAAPKSAETCENTKSAVSSAKILHPVMVAAELPEILELNPFKNTEQNTILHHCIRLAALLSYEYLHARANDCDSKPSQLPSDVFVIASTSNCMIIFRQETKSAEGKSEAEAIVEAKSNEASEEHGEEEKLEKPEAAVETQTALMKLLCSECQSVPEAIDFTIDKIFQTTKVCLDEKTMIPHLLKAIAPPDWIAMVMARIYLKNA